MDWKNGNRTRYTLAAVAALVLILMLAAPILSVNAIFARLDATYIECMDGIFSLSDGASMFGSLLDEFGGVSSEMRTLRAVSMLLGFLMALGLIAVILTLALALIPGMSEKNCRRAAIAGAAIPGTLLVLILVACFEARFGFSVLTFWYWLMLAALVYIYRIGSRLCGDEPVRKRTVRLPIIGGISAGKPSASGCLEGCSGMYTNARIPVAAGAVITIGRDPQVANVVIQHQNEDISRRHCSIRMDGQGRGYLVTDYSSFGTYYNNPNLGGMVLQLPKNVETPLARGTKIALGRRGNVFYLN